jgi:hypothetical protein
MNGEDRELRPWQERRSGWLDTLQPDNWWVTQAGRNWGYQHPSTVEAPPDAAQVGSDAYSGWVTSGQTPSDWWQTPGLTPDMIGLLSQEQYGGMPQYPFFEGSGYKTPEEFYGWYQGLPEQESVRGAALADLQSQYDREQGRLAALDLITGTRDRLQTGFESWEADPYRTAAMDELMRRSQPGFSIISPEEQGEIDLGLAQQMVAAQMRADTSAAGRGVYGGGAHTARDQAIEAYTRAGANRADAIIAAENARQQAAATGAMGRFAGGFEQLDLAYSDAMTAADAAIAELEMGIEPSDAAVWPTLDLAFEELARQTDLMERGFEAYDRASQKTWEDRVALLADLSGTGVFNKLFNLWGGFTNAR